MLRKTVLAFAAAVLFGAPAFAADLIEEVPPAPIPLATSGWYLRGDVGYVFKSNNNGHWDFWNQFPGVEGVDDTFYYKDFDLDDAASFGGGVGYRFNDFLRTDVTADYFSPDLDGRRGCPSYIAATQYGQAAPDITCKYKDSADVDIVTVMANAYVDLGTYSIFTPYIGGGLGAAYVDYGNLKVEQCGTSDCGASPNDNVFHNKGEDSWRFAGSLMAGVTMDVTGPLKLDVGYKYTHITDGDAFGYDAADRATGAKGAQIKDDGFDLHTIRAGLRYEFF
ncbi:outer membrane protein [Aureimonas leprariae]|uniref:Porin family protein n=1 Tax=Plantimonas leprariae TaxID=2615207 RepID=A0A7V7TVK3_9HYPH|nr:outer membrane protein [Aureimonas leprariae]KAB0678026.1 porin family protein [Aureimonas leprariae]